MNWWLNFYFGEGPGIPKDAPRPTGLRLLGQTILREWWNLIVLNLIFLAACLPLITIPAAWVAMTRVTSRMIEDEPCEPWPEFRDTFRRTFPRALAFGLGTAIALTLAITAFRAYLTAAQDNILFVLPMVVAACVTLGMAILAIFMADLIANRSASLSTLVHAAFIATLMRPLPILLALAANAALWALHIIAYPSTILLAVTINFSFGALFLSFAAHDTARLAFEHITKKPHLNPRQEQRA